MSGQERVPIGYTLTPMQLRVIQLGHEGLSDADIAAVLKVKVTTVRSHWREVGHHVPGDWPLRSRIILWWRGASEDLLHRVPVRVILPAPSAEDHAGLLERLKPRTQSLLERLRPQSDGAGAQGQR